MVLDLTLPGLGGSRRRDAPSAPAAPPPPPTQVQAGQRVAGRPQGPGTATNIRNEGGGRGIPTAMTQRALKQLTGQ